MTPLILGFRKTPRDPLAKRRYQSGDLVTEPFILPTQRCKPDALLLVSQHVRAGFLLRRDHFTGFRLLERVVRVVVELEATSSFHDPEVSEGNQLPHGCSSLASPFMA